MRLWRRKPKVIQIKDLELNPLETIFEVENLEQLRRHCKTIYETDQAYYSKNEDGIFRLKKPAFQPTIRKVKGVTYDPASQKVWLDKKELFRLATDLDLEIFESDDFFIILTSGLLFIAQKESEEVTSHD